MKEAIILAGGLGTRLAKTVKDRQKVMAPVGGRPFLDYVLLYLKEQGFSKIILAVAFHNEQIREYYGTCFEGIEISYSVEKEPLGTGGAIKQALQFSSQSYVAVINGDTFFKIDFDALYNLAKEKNAHIVLAAKEMPDCTRHSTLEIGNNSRILQFSEKKENGKGYINGGAYVIRKDIFEKCPDGKFSFEKELLEKMKDGLYAVKSDSYFIDMGVPEAYFRANTEIPLLFGKNTFPAAFLDRDGVICKEKHHLYKCEDFEFIEGAPEAIEKLREQGFLIFIVTNQAGVAKGLYTENDVSILHKFMLEKLQDITHIDGIYYCPYHEQGIIEEYTKPSYDRKPSPGMIEKAVRDMKKLGIEIDLAKSILIGDKLSDIEAGKNAKIGKTVLVRSGHKIDESTTLPDIIADSLSDFVNTGCEN